MEAKIIVHICRCRHCYNTFHRRIWWDDGEWWVEMHTHDGELLNVATIYSVKRMVKARQMNSR